MESNRIGADLRMSFPSNRYVILWGQPRSYVTSFERKEYIAFPLVIEIEAGDYLLVDQVRQKVLSLRDGSEVKDWELGD